MLGELLEKEREGGGGEREGGGGERGGGGRGVRGKYISIVRYYYIL